MSLKYEIKKHGLTTVKSRANYAVSVGCYTSVHSIH